MRRDDAASTLIRRHFDVMFLLGNRPEVRFFQEDSREAILNRIYHRSPIQIEKSQTEGIRIMPETRLRILSEFYGCELKKSSKLFILASEAGFIVRSLEGFNVFAFLSFG